MLGGGPSIKNLVRNMFGRLAGTVGSAEVKAAVVDVTTVAVKIVALPTIADKFSPEVVFATLRTLAAEVAAATESFGGHLDSRFNSGFTCIFGNGASDMSHADRAVMCAMQLQQSNVPKLIEDGAQGRPVYCLRIGIASGTIYAGSVFGRMPAELGLVGHSVELLSSLVDACDAHAVLVHSSTSDSFKEIDARASSFKRRIVHVAKDAAPHNVLVFDPFEFEPEVRQEAARVLSSCAAMERLEHRWPITLPTALVVKVGGDSVVPLNVSRGGMQFLDNVARPVGSDVVLEVSAVNEDQRSRLEKRRLTRLVAEVRSLVPHAGAPKVGTSYKGLDERQKDLLLATLLESQGHGR